MLPTKKQLEKLGRRYRKRQETPDDRRLLTEYRNLCARDLPNTLGTIESFVSDYPIVISARAKRVDTIIRKLRREQTLQLPNMADVLGIRIIAPNVRLQLEIATELKNGSELYMPVKDYLEHPQSSGYRGLHLIAKVSDSSPRNFSHEIQLRTPYQHLWATYSESYGEKVKEGGGKANVRKFLSDLSDNIKAFEDKSPDLYQVNLADTSGSSASAFQVLVFDKKKGETRQTLRCSNLTEAISVHTALEDRFSQNFDNEIVLLLTNNPPEALTQTHARYFNFRGRPRIPSELMGTLQLPAD